MLQAISQKQVFSDSPVENVIGPLLQSYVDWQKGRIAQVKENPKETLMSFMDEYANSILPMGISRSAASRKLGQMLQMSKRDPRVQELIDFIPKPMMDKVYGMIGNFDRYVDYRDKVLRPIKNEIVDKWDNKQLGGLNTLDGITLQRASTPLNHIIAHEVGHSMASLGGDIPDNISDTLRQFTNISIHNMDELIAETYSAILMDNKPFIKAVSSLGPEYRKIVNSVMNNVGKARIKDFQGSMDAYRKRPVSGKNE